MANIHDVNESLQVQPSVRNLPTLIALSQGENGRSLQFRMVGATIPSGSSASLSGTKPDGVVYSKAGTVDGNTVIFQEDVQLTAVAGAWDAKIHIVNSGNSVATALIRFIIDPDPVAAGAVPSDSQLEGIVAECKMYAENAKSAAYGSPLTASLAADMIDQTRVYVYTGDETGYTEGHWYYYDGSAWADGGVYNSTAFQTDTTLSISGMAADAKAAGDALATKADKIGNIALAERLYGGEYTSESEPYHFRQAPEAMGAKSETIVGGSLAWNQLVQNGDFSDETNNWGKSGANDAYSVSNNICTLTLSETPVNYYGHRIHQNVGDLSNGHKVLACGKMKAAKQCGFIIALTNSTPGSSLSKSNTANQWTIVSNIFSVSEATSYSLQVSPGYQYDVLSAGDTIESTEIILIDLTALFGPTIADYIYSLEQATAGAGVAWVKRYIDLDTYHEYDAGSIQSVEGLVSHDVVGFNQLDEDNAEWVSGYYIDENGTAASSANYKYSNAYAEILPNTEYALTLYKDSDLSLASRIVYYDANKTFLGRSDSMTTSTARGRYTHSFITLNNAKYIRLDLPKDCHDICINLSDPSRNGTYEPYEKHSYPLDSSVTLRGVPKLVTDHIEFDGDKYHADGSVKRRYQQRAYQSGDESLANAITDGTTTVVKLTTPTTETAQPFQSPMIVGATEEYISDSVVPVGHESRYYEDVAKKVNGLPKDFSTLIAPVEVTFTATRNYSVDSYLIVKNQLYKATSAISSGGTITPNSNVTATTIMAEILALA